MQHPFGAFTRKFRLRKFRGQRPAGPAGEGETRVVSAKCLMILNDHPPDLLLFHKIHCGSVSIEIEKDKHMFKYNK